jgi:hypothetical protein
MDMPNFNIYLGAYASWLDSSAAKSGNTDERYGARCGLNISSDRFPGLRRKRLTRATGTQTAVNL